MKTVKAVALGAGVFVVLCLVVIAAIIALADPNRYKPQIAAKVAAATGRRLSIDGPIEWGFFPKLRLKAGAVALGNTEGFGPEPFVAAKAIEVSVATLPLLARKVEMDAFKLYGAEIHLVRRQDGTTNWTDLVRGGTPGERPEGGAKAFALALGGVDIRDAAFTFRDARSGREIALTKLDLETGPFTLAAPVDFKLGADLAVTRPALTGRITIAGSARCDPAGGRYTVEPFALDLAADGPDLPGGKGAVHAGFALDVNRERGTLALTGLVLDGPGLALAGELHADHLNGAHPGGKGRLTIDGEDLAVLFKALGLPAADRLATLPDRRFGLKAAFDADMDSGVAKMPTLDAKLVGATLSGELGFERANTDEPAVHGKLHAAGADLPAVVLVASQIRGLDAAQSEAIQRALARAGEKSFDIAATLEADLATGEMKLPDLGAQILGNALAGHLAASGKGDDLTVNGALQANGKDLPALLAVGAGFGGGAGLGSFAQKLAGTADKSFTLATTFEAKPAAGRIRVPKLDAKALAATAAARFDAGKDRIEGKLELRDEQPGIVLAALGQSDLANAVKTLALEAAVQGTRADLAISPLELRAAVDGVGDLVLGAGSARVSLTNDTARIEDLRLSGLGLDLKGRLQAATISSTPAFDGELDMPAANLRKALSDLRVELGPMADPKALTAVALHTKLKGTARSLTLDPLTLKIDDGTLEGRIAVQDFTGPDLAFQLTLDQLNADRYLPPKAGKATPEAAAAGAALLPVERLRKVKLDGRLDAGSLRISGAKLAHVALGVHGSGGRLAMSPIAAELYQGRYDGHAAIDATGAEAKLDIDTKIANVALEPLLQDVADKDMIAGTASLDLHLSALGGTTARLKNTLAGRIAVDVRNGIFRGVDVPAVLHAAEIAIESKNVPPIPHGGETPFQSLTGTLDLHQGTITTKDLVMKGIGFKITDEGMLANLNDMSWKHDPQIAVDESSATAGTKTYKLGGYTIPLRCRGEISGKSCLPDFGDLAQEAAKSAVKKQIEKKGGDVLKKLFKGF